MCKKKNLFKESWNDDTIRSFYIIYIKNLLYNIQLFNEQMIVMRIEYLIC